MLWSWELKPTTESSLADFDLLKRHQIIEKLDWLAINFDSLAPVSLKGELKEFFKLRVGDIIIFYKVDWRANKIIVCYIAKRDKAYQ